MPILSVGNGQVLAVESLSFSPEADLVLSAADSEANKSKGATQASVQAAPNVFIDPILHTLYSTGLMYMLT